MDKYDQDLHQILGTHSIQKRSTKKLQTRWDDQITKYHFGQNVFTNKTSEAADHLLKRDFKNIYDFKETSKPLGLTIIPIGFIPAKPHILDLDLDKDMMNMSLKAENASLDEQKKFQNDRVKAVGDVAERSVYDALKCFYQKRKNETVLAIKNLHMLKINSPQRAKQNMREIDFYVIHYDLGLVINIEVKNSLGPHNLAIVKTQLQENKAYFEDWFSADICDKWKYVSMLYIEQEIPDQFQDEIGDCKPYLISGKDMLESALNDLHNKRAATKIPVQEFKLIAKYLLYCSPAISLPLPIGKEYDRVLNEAMSKQRSLENLKIWCFPTPEQKMALQKSHVLFLSTFGTGKTLLMCAKASELAETGEKVLYLIFHKGELTTVKTLLCLRMEKDFESCPNITVKQINFINGQSNNLQKIMKGFDHIFIDEFFDDFIHLSAPSKNDFVHAVMGKKTIWMALSGSFDHAAYELKERHLLPEKAKKWFPTCKLEIVQLDIPLRTPPFFSKKMKEVIEGRIEMDLNNVLLLSTREPPTLIEGRCDVIKIQQLNSLTDDLKQCFEKVPTNTFGLIIVEDSLYYLPNEHMEHTDNLVQILFDASFKELGMDLPLYWTKTDQSPKDEIQKWMSEKHNWLVTSYRMAMGFTCSLVINLGGFDSSARCSSHLIYPDPSPNWAIKTIPVINYFESRSAKRSTKVLKLKAPHEIIDNMISYEGTGLKRSEVFYDYMDDENPLMETIHDLIKKDPKMSHFLKHEIHITRLICYARMKLNENPRTRHVCADFEGYDDFKLSVITMYEHMWAIHSLEEFIDMEDRIMNIMACFLQRKIIFRPLFKSARNLPEAVVPKVFQSHFNEAYYIFGVRSGLQSLYISAIPCSQ